MDWIKQNTFLAAFSGVMIAGVLGLGFFAFSSWKGYSAAVDDFEQTREALDRLENSALHPNPDNVAKVRAAVDDYDKSVTDLFTKLKAAQKPLPADLDPTKFGESIQAKLAPLQEKAAGKDISLGDNFYLGMDRYRNKTPDEKVLPMLEWSLGGIALLTDLALGAGIETLNEFRFYEQGWENPGAEPEEERPRNRRDRDRRRRNTGSGSSSGGGATVKPADVIDSARVRLRVTGTPDSITRLMNDISNNKEYFYWVRWAKIANEKVSGPDRHATFAPQPIEQDAGAGDALPGDAQPVTPPPTDATPPADAGTPADGDAAAPAPEAAATFPEEVAPAMRDVFPILGTERLRADLLIDIPRFRDPPAPEKKESGRSSR